MEAASGTAKNGVVALMGMMRLELVMNSIVPVVVAGVLGIYGSIIVVIIRTGINPKAKSYYVLMVMPICLQDLRADSRVYWQACYRFCGRYWCEVFLLVPL